MITINKLVLFLILICLSIGLSTSSKQQYLSDLILLITDRTRYDRNHYAPTQNGSAIRVDVNIDVTDLRDISELTMTFRVEIYFTQIWNDPRLIMNENYTNVSFTTLNPDYLENLWIPDTFFSNVLESIAPPKDADSFTHKNLLQINGKGDVYFSQRLSLTAACMMKLKNYPFDYQLCKLSFESYGIEKKNMEYKWKNVKSVTVLDLSLPDFKLKNVTTTESTVFFDNIGYSRLSLCFYMERKTAFYFMELYVPAILIVISAWLSTIGNQSGFSDILGVLLAMLFLYFSYITVMPRVSDVKAMDVFLIGCFAFIFLSLLQTFINTEETIYENFKHRKRDPSPSVSESISYIKVQPYADSLLDEYSEKRVLKKRKIIRHKTKLTRMQKFCKYVTFRNFFMYAMYPTAFTLFCLFYFVTYMSVIKNHYKMEDC